MYLTADCPRPRPDLYTEDTVFHHASLMPKVSGIAEPAEAPKTAGSWLLARQAGSLLERLARYQKTEDRQGPCGSGDQHSSFFLSE